MELTFVPKRIAKVVGLVILGLTTTNVFMKLSKYWLGTYPRGHRLFDVDTEQNIPAWYSSSLLLVCAGLLGLIAYIKHNQVAPYRYYWSFLSIVFLGLSIDEAVSLHEKTIEPLRTAFNLSGVFLNSWILLGLAFVTALGVTYFKFLLDLPSKTRVLFLIAVVLYVLGAVGFEMVGAPLWQATGFQTLSYDLIATLEELFEMLGINVFLYALLSYLFAYLNVRVSFEQEKL